jgi:putative transcriptional regulator
MSNKFFKDLKKSLEEVVAYKKGKLNLYSEYIEIPEPPAEYKAKDIKKKMITK